MQIVKGIILIILGLGAGVVISGAVFALIAALGVIPRIAKKTKTEKYVKIYEEALIIGGILSTFMVMFNLYVPIGSFFVAIISTCIGIFYGCMAVSLAEVINVIPILTRRARLQRGMFYFISSIALGKLVGSLSYFCISGFFEK